MVTVIAGIASAKLAAWLIGPSGVGNVSLVQGVSATIAAVIELGLATSIVRAHANGGFSTLPELGRVARRTIVLGGLILILAAAVVARPGAEIVFDDGHRPVDFVLAAAAGLPVALLALENGTLIAAHRVGAVARVAVATAFVSPTVNLIWYSVEGEDGVAPGALTSAVVVLVVARQIRGWELRRRPADQPRPAPTAAATPTSIRRRLLGDGLPVMASALAGAAALLLLPIMVAGRIGPDDVGFFRAANVISVGYTAALSVVIGADFLPRVSRVRDDPSAVRVAVVDQANLLVSVLVPMLCAVAAVLPLLVEILYRRDFAPTVRILEWQLSGDLLRVVASVLATAVFARFGGPARLASELVGLALLVGLSMFGLQAAGLAGLGWGFTLTYGCYLIVLAVVLGFGVTDPATRRCLARLVLGALAIGVPSWMVHATGASWTRLIGLPLAVAFAIPTGRDILRSRRRPEVSS